LFLEVCLNAKSRLWYFNSGCPRYTTRDASIFTEFQKQKSGKVIFGDNGRGNILDIGKIVKNSTNSIENIYLVDGFKSNLLSSSQHCDEGNRLSFDDSQCAIENFRTNDIDLCVLD